MTRMRDCLAAGNGTRSLAMLALNLLIHDADGSGVPFVQPVDAATLRDAMMTGSPGNDRAQYRECQVGDGSVVLHYWLRFEGSGVGSVSGNSTDLGDSTISLRQT